MVGNSSYFYRQMSNMNTTTRAEVKQRLDQEISTIYESLSAHSEFSFSKDRTSFSDFLADKMLIILLIRKGVPYSLFNVIQDYAPFTENDWASLLDISTKSLQRYKQDSRHFRPFQSEKIIEMSEVTNIGLEVFGDMNKFKLWLDTPNFSLGKLKPIDLLRDSYGKEMVVAELIRISHGLLS